MKEGIKVDADILDCQTYEDMNMELELLNEQQFYASVASRIAEGDTDPNRRSFSLEEAMGAQGYADYLSIDADAVADEDLFEIAEKRLKAGSE